MLKIFRYMRQKEWLLICAGLLFIVVQVWLDLKTPDYMSEITRLVQTPGSAMKDVWKSGGFMLLCALGSLAAALCIGFLAARVSANLGKELRSRLFHKVTDFSMEEVGRFSTSSLITRATNDISQIQMLVTIGMQFIIRAPIMGVWAIFKIAGKGFEWTVATVIAVAFQVVMMSIIMFFVLPKFKIMQTLTDNLNRVTRENLTGLRVVRAYNAEEYQENKFEIANNELTRAHLFTGRAMSILMPIMTMITSGLSLAIYWIGATLINAAAMTDRLTLFSNMVVFSSYAMQVIMSFIMLVIIFMLLPRGMVSARRINEVLDTEPNIQDGNKTEGEPDLFGKVEFKNVSFRYPDAKESVLENINFTVNRGETIAFIGSTGSGKSTLINLIPRFYDVTEGEVLVDGINVCEYKQEALYNKIGYVSQKAVLFRGTIKSNVAYGSNGIGEYTIDSVKTAVGVAQGKEFVEAMENDYEAAVSQGGANLSGGQKQRIAIARAVCRKPEIYIFDDSFSALDYKTDRVLRSELKLQTAGVTTIIVAQRIGTILDADRILVLDEGRVIGQGTHDELLESCEIYKQIALSQLSEEELVS